MSTRRGIVIGAGSFFALCGVIGVAKDTGASVSESAHAAVASAMPTATAPATVYKTHTVTVPASPAKLPQACLDYIRQVDEQTQSVLDYDSALSQMKAAEDAASNALADHDQEALSEARTKLNKVLNDTIGPYVALTESQQTSLKRAQDACRKAAGG